MHAQKSEILKLSSCKESRLYSARLNTIPFEVRSILLARDFSPCRSQNSKYIPNQKLPLDSLSTLNLSEGKTILLSPPSKNYRLLRLFFHKGVARICGSFGDNYQDITLAFCGPSESGSIKLPFEQNLLLEALSSCSLDIEYIQEDQSDENFMWQWLFDLHLVRHPVGAEARLISLLKLLVNKFGIRRGDGYFLPFPIGHSRIAELIGTTRSTVTRQITLLREQNDLILNQPEGNFILSAKLIETEARGEQE